MLWLIGVHAHLDVSGELPAPHFGQIQPVMPTGVF